MARIIDESFEVVGFEETWTTSITGSGTIDEYNAGPGTLATGGGSRCLRIVASASSRTLATRDYGSQTNTAHIRAYIYVGTHSIGSSASIDHILAFGTSAAASENNSLGIRLSTVGSQLVLSPNYHTSAGWQSMTTANIATGTWYRVEVLIDTTNSVVEWRLDGTQIQRATGVTLDRGGCRYLHLGTPYSVTPTATIYYDLVAVDDSGWVGAEQGSAAALATRVLLLGVGV
jgi:hypothetical protein